MQDVNTHKISRESGLAAGIPGSVPATTISMACISSNMAITSAVEAIRCGRIESAIAGGVEVLSDLPIRYKKPLRQKLVETRKYRKPRSEEHTSELQSRGQLVCRLLLEQKKASLQRC